VLVKRHRLIRPMITGRQEVPAGQAMPPAPRAGSAFGLLVAVALAAAGVLALLGAGETSVAARPAAAKAPAAAPAW
jgi:hypothetical protein